jgi:hypothetical protein
MRSRKWILVLSLLGPAFWAGGCGGVTSENVQEKVIRTEDLGGAPTEQDQRAKEREQLAEMGVPGMAPRSQGQKKSSAKTGR